MKNNLMIKIFMSVLVCTFFAVFASAQNNPCAELKNKTYIAFNEGKFDDYANAAGAIRVKFNADGTIGTARTFAAYTLDAANGTHQTIIFTCKKTDKGGGYFELTVGNTKTSAGAMFFKSFDRGARLWVKSNIPNRDTPYWMIELPAAPQGEQFPK